jgi:hypothetical protein
MLVSHELILMFLSVSVSFLLTILIPKWDLYFVMSIIRIVEQ